MLGGELRLLRERQGLSLREVARQAQISPEALSSIESGKRYPSLRTLEALAGALRIQVIIGPEETTIEPVP
jgi:transcriptional regulator with XRE-family HTH domain